jgi:hypothetical protein
VDDEDDKMDMEEGGGGSSSGTAVEKPYYFKSGPVFVKRVGASDTEARQFTVDQREEMEQYIQSLSRPPAASSSGAAGGSVLNDEDMLFHALDTVRYLNKECKKLYAENAKLGRKAKCPPDQAMELLEVMFLFLILGLDFLDDCVFQSVEQAHRP